jgi:hypothetical protein
VSARRVPTDQDARRAVERLLAAVGGGENIFVALDEITPLHPKNNTFPGEVFMRLAADALQEGGVRRDSPLSEEDLVKRYLPECEFRGRNNHKIRYAVLAAAATRGGIDVDLLEEVVYWGTDDFWTYAALAAVAWIRAVADQRAVPVAELCARLSAQPRG